MCNDSETDPRVDVGACRKVGLRSMVAAPLIYNDAAVGVLKITAAEPNVFTNQHVRILELMCGLIATAMHRAVTIETNELYYRATHDSLTGLANRALFYDRLRNGLTLAARQSSRLGILNIDMDGLKRINDQFGHRAGDAAITETGRRISQISRKSDTVARLGGDEFGVILMDIEDKDSAACHADRLVKEIRRNFFFENNQLFLGASIGLAAFPDDGHEVESLIEQADKEMYAIKRTRQTQRV